MNDVGELRSRNDLERDIERLARDAYGKLLAYIAARTGDVAAAEDALAEAFLSALTTWPRDGVPLNPEAWLLTAARRRVLDGYRRAKVREVATNVVVQLADEQASAAGHELDDDRLRLMFVCAHPAIDGAIRAPLMLQVVLGLDAETIASAMRVAPKTLAQRLWRSKTKIRDAGVSFELPDGEGAMRERAGYVREAIYGAYATGWNAHDGVDAERGELTREAIWLARILLRQLPGDAETAGLLSLMLLAEARRAARRGVGGVYVPLDEQDASLWDAGAIEEGLGLLSRAAESGDVGAFQIEAAIQAAHCVRVRDGIDNRRAIVGLYDVLLGLAPSLGAEVGRAAAIGASESAAAGIAALDRIDAARVSDYQPYWATRGHLLARLGADGDAEAALRRAAGLSDDAAVRAYLLSRIGA